jgi:hypothetical protein
MYQLFNGYHLGSNRAVFLMLTRPHIMNNTSEQVEINVVGGQRRLEGIQEMFLVIHVPAALLAAGKGVCVQAALDTVHEVSLTSGTAFRINISGQEIPTIPFAGPSAFAAPAAPTSSAAFSGDSYRRYSACRASLRPGQ